MRYTGPKNKVSRRESVDLGLKTSGSKAHGTLLKKLNILPGQHGTRFRRKVSEHGKQLREKQKLRFLFGVTEKQLKNYFSVASRKRGNTAVFLGELLERRLDNVVYRLGLTPTRAAARQLVSHGHIAVNGKVLDIPSYILKTGETVAFAADESKKIPYIDLYRSQNEVILPTWLTLKKDTGTLSATPDNTYIDQQINLRLVVEFYSR